MTTNKVPSPIETPSHLILGEILRPHGVRGELRVKLLTAHPDHLKQLKTVFVGAGIGARNVKPYTLSSIKILGDGYAIIRLEEVPDRNAADRFRMQMLMVALADAVPLEDGEFYLYQLIGMKVQQEDGSPLGTLIEVLETGANDVYVVRGDAHGEVLIPVIDGVILSTDVENSLLTVRLPEGLLDTVSDADEED
ncbi:MAG: ribosome maturation factor RimM [Pleurocapsa minor GSE-CHR-MK-17-07R]|nr:ribosome maturation factor RimM [Pleurocapsa minor GSE-CHR-MK 17-07R]